VSPPTLLLLQDVIEEPKLIDWEWIKENFWEDIVPAIQGHIFLSFVSIAIALAIALPVGILSARFRKAYPPVTAVTGILYSIPNRQILFRVELPLALPIIVAGIRIATVTIIGIATIGAYINGGGLGTLIFDGIGRQFPTMIISGAVLATVLAIVADLLLLALERYLRPWARVRRT
jgi:osmoprotectant transport system permease protein